MVRDLGLVVMLESVGMKTGFYCIRTVDGLDPHFRHSIRATRSDGPFDWLLLAGFGIGNVSFVLPALKRVGR